MNHRFEELMSLYLDGDWTASDVHELCGLLKADAAWRREFRELMFLHALLRKETRNQAAVSRSVTGGFRRPVAMAAGILAVLGAGLALWWAGHPAGDSNRTLLPSAKVVHVSGRADLLASGTMSAVQKGMVMRPGDTLMTGVGRVEVGMVDGSVARLGPQSTLSLLDDRAGMRLGLDRGECEYRVEPQASGRAFAVVTPQANVVVAGTRFSVRVDNKITELHVDKGRVKMIRRTDGAAVEVSAGEQARAGAGIPLAVEPAAVTRLYLDFEDGTLPSGSLGAIVTGPPAPGSRFCVAGIYNEPDRIHRVDIRSEDPALFTYRGDGVLVFDYWVGKGTGAIDVYFWNITRSISPGYTVWRPVEEKWTRQVIRLGEMRNQDSRDGDIIGDLTIQTTPGGNKIFIDNLELRQAGERP